MKAMALDESDRRTAAVVWAGLFAGGPLLPVVLLVVSWSRVGSLTKRHAVAACCMHLAALLIWVPVVVSQLMLTTDDPPVWVFVLAGVLFLTMVLCSVAGLVLALRAPVGDALRNRRSEV